MDIFFHDPTDIPLPPNEVRVRELRVQPYPDGRRVRVYLEITPFLKKPSGELVIYDGQGQPVAMANIIETIDPRMEMTMHLRTANPAGQFTLVAEVFYQEADIPDEESEIQPSMLERQVVDRVEQSFTIEAKGA